MSNRKCTIITDIDYEDYSDNYSDSESDYYSSSEFSQEEYENPEVPEEPLCFDEFNKYKNFLTRLSSPNRKHGMHYI